MQADNMRAMVRRVRAWLTPASVAALAVGAGLALWLFWPFAESSVPPEERVVLIRTTACGLASPTSGLGVAVGGDRVVSAAHTLAQADRVEIVRDGTPSPARVVAWDGQADLAVLEVDGLDVAPVGFTSLMAGDQAGVALSSSLVSADVTLVAQVTIEEVLGTDRHRRPGYQVRAQAEDGDSGAGVFDETGRLAGVLFAVERDSGLAWATAASEIEAILAAPTVEHRCQPDDSRLRPVSGS